MLRSDTAWTFATDPFETCAIEISPETPQAVPSAQSSAAEMPCASSEPMG